MDPRLRVQLAGGAEAGQQAPVLGDVVGGDADELGRLRQGLPVAASLTTAPYPAGPGLPRDPPSASTTNSRIGLDPLPVIPYSPDSAVRTRMRRQFSQRTTVSGAAARISFSSVMASS